MGMDKTLDDVAIKLAGLSKSTLLNDFCADASH
jgi:hypothetical protein